MEIAKIAVKETTGVVVLRKRIPAGIVGATVSVLFDSPVWGPLQKVVTFRVGDETLPAEFDGSNAVIPHECTKEPGKVLFFGIWGHDPETGLQLPLIEVRIGQIENATDPNATPATDPTLPIWAQLQAEIEQLKQSGVSEEKIAQVVNDYLAKNPPSVTETDPTVPSWAKQPEKPSYTADEVGALSKDALGEAINDALAQANESGEFDGKDGYTPVKGKDYFDGEPGEDYVLTDADKAEIAEQAAGLVEIPEPGDKLFSVTVTEDDNGLFWADKTLMEILEANATGMDVQSVLVGDGIRYILQLSMLSENGAKFQRVVLDDDAVGIIAVIVTNETGTKGTMAAATMDILARGVDIPTDEHINQLINTALGVIENGTY